MADFTDFLGSVETQSGGRRVPPEVSNPAGAHVCRRPRNRGRAPTACQQHANWDHMRGQHAAQQAPAGALHTHWQHRKLHSRHSSTPGTTTLLSCLRQRMPVNCTWHSFLLNNAEQHMCICTIPCSNTHMPLELPFHRLSSVAPLCTHAHTCMSGRSYVLALASSAVQVLAGLAELDCPTVFNAVHQLTPKPFKVKDQWRDPYSIDPSTQ